MLVKGILLLASAALAHAHGLTCEEKPHPVDLKYYCIKVIRYDDIPEKSPVLLIHGLASSLRGWNGVYQVLANSTRRTICMVDLRNHGSSPWSNITDTATMTADVAHFVERKNFAKVNPIGHSLGGKVTVDFMLKYPCRVNTGVVEDMRPNGISLEAYILVLLVFEIEKAAIDSVPDGLNKTQAKEHIVEFVNNIFKLFGSNMTLEPGAADAIDLCFIDGKWQYKYNLDAIRSGIRNVANFLRHSSGLFEKPVLFIYGTESPFKVWEAKEEILYLFPKAELVPVEGASHTIHGPLFPIYLEKVLQLLNTVD